MIEIIKNKDNLTDKDIDEIITRVKALIVNSKREILLGYSYYEYQFPGGHVKEYEGLLDALKRELKEETGLDYKVTNLKPIGILKKYIKDYPKVGMNSLYVIYYYEINDDRIPSLSTTNYTDEEKDGNFKLYYVPLDMAASIINKNASIYGDTAGIVEEMDEFFKCYFNKSV